MTARLAGLLERLRTLGSYGNKPYPTHWINPDGEEAATAIEDLLARIAALESENAAAGRNVYRLQADNAALVLAIKPFARAASNVPKRWPDTATCELSTECGPSDIPENCERARLIISFDGISISDLRRAALTLKENDDVT